MADWRQMTLRDVCAESGGGIQTGPFGSQLHASDYVVDGTPSVMPQNIGDNRIVDDGIARVSAPDMLRLEKYWLRANDIVYSRRGDVERRALVRPENDGWLCGTGCLRVRILDQDVHDSPFISYSLGLPESRAWITRHAVGATMLNLNTEILGRVPLAVPDIEIQRAIGGVLGALDDKIAANDRVVTAADALAEALLARVATGNVALSDIAQITMGSSPPGASYNESGDGMAFFQGVRDFGVRSPSRRVFTTAPVRVADAEDTLVSVRAPVGRTNLAREQLCLGRGLAGLRSRSGRPMTLFHQIRAARHAWEPYEAEGTVFGAINKGQMERITVPGVPSTRAETLESTLRPIEERIQAALKESEVLRATRDELLPLLMSGKVPVRDLPDDLTEAALR
ncbi:restriction endonuclease subunit S [Nocardioides kribbensis]|uniref:restriction endonuclease subunit S n=1 Tax=Nocardioides kribbensis TaxID=305517 RepID=UPI00187A210E|nr:restriction endonuclease subunit S [Nocardioides kribbensis]